MTINSDDDIVGPPTEPEVGPPIPGKSIGAAPTISPDDAAAMTPSGNPESAADGKAKALHRAIHAIGKPWGNPF